MAGIVNKVGETLNIGGNKKEDEHKAGDHKAGEHHDKQKYGEHKAGEQHCGEHKEGFVEKVKVKDKIQGGKDCKEGEKK